MTLFIRLNMAYLSHIYNCWMMETPQRIDMMIVTIELLTVCFEEFESNVLVAMQEKGLFCNNSNIKTP